MDPNEDPVPPVGDVLGRLREDIAERRQAGYYPDGLEEDLDEPYRRAGSSLSPAVDPARVRADLAELVRRAGFDLSRISTASSVPGGEVVHRAAGKLVTRQTHGLVEQLQGFAEQTLVLFEALLDLVDDHLELHGDLAGRLDAIIERLNRLDRAPLRPEQEVDDLRRRIERLEQLQARHDFHPWYRSERFEQTFRGSRDELIERYRDLVEQFRGRSPVLDIGFGRGEFLQLLKEIGVEARGVDIDPDLVKAGLEQGLDVAVGDAVGALAHYADGGLGGIVLIQVVEHLSPQEVLDLIALAADKLRPGGRLVMETVNPQSLYVFAHSFYIDPTHSRPIHPGYLDFLCREAGFSSVATDWRSVPRDRLVAVEEPPELKTNFERLNELVFGPGDYAVIATR